MTISEKIRIISNWSHRFTVYQRPNGRWVGEILYSDFNQPFFTSYYWGHDEAVDNAFALVEQYITIQIGGIDG